MVFRDYLVRCKRCKIPYIPKNVSRIKTCIFCRRNPEEDKNERLKIINGDIKIYSQTQGNEPTDEIIKLWIKLKFDLSDKKTDEYFKFFQSQNAQVITKKEKTQRIAAINA